MKAAVFGLALASALLIGAGIPKETGGPFHVAYIVPAGTVGNQQLPPSQAQSIGMDFDVNEDIDVLALGVFDSEGDGFPSPLHARIYDRDTKDSVAQIWFLPCDPGKLRDGSRFISLRKPLRLRAGFHGTISVAYLGNPLEPNGNVRVSEGNWTTDGADGALSFVGMGRHCWMGSGDVFPDLEDPSPVPNTFAAGTFLYRVSKTDESRGAKSR